MTQAKPIEDQILELLKDHLAALGYTGIRKETFAPNHPSREGLFNMVIEDMVEEHRLTKRPKCQFYMDDMYPSKDKEEAFFYVWNRIGMSSKVEAQRIANHLNFQGIPARATTHRGDYGVRFKFDYDWGF